jgi:hypothetical protein
MCKISILLHSFLVNRTLLTKSVLLMTASSKSNDMFENYTMMPLDEAPHGSRKMFVPHASTKLPVNHRSDSVFWQPWMGTILLNLSTVHSAQDLNELIIE